MLLYVYAAANCPDSVSDVSHHDQLFQNNLPKRLHQKSFQSTRRSTGGTTHNVRRHLRADNSANTFASPTTPNVRGPSVMPTPGSHSSLVIRICPSTEHNFFYKNFFYPHTLIHTQIKIYIYLCAESTPSYEDLGDCDQRCRHCGAAFWYEERVKRSSTNARTEYHLFCGDGKFVMDQEPDPPEYIKHLLSNRNFMDNIRAYNQMFAITSFGETIDKSVNAGRGPYVFKVSGQIYHWIGSLWPLNDNDTPRFLQLYIYDTKNEVQNRLIHFEPSERAALDPEIVQGLIHFFDTHNELVQVLRTARDLCNETNIPEFKLRLYNTLAAIVFDSGPTSEADYDVIIQYKGSQPQRINKLHKSYMSLQFPLIFIYGQPGYHTELTLRSADPTQRPKRDSLNAFYTYQLHPRPDSYDLLFRTGLYDAVSRGDCDGSDAGSRIILPSSFTGGPRYMYSHYLDALAICRKLGNPQFFITFT